MKNRALATARTQCVSCWIHKYIKIFGFAPSAHSREYMVMDARKEIK